eukprot:CAMPEP_0197849460 /NCGR_PEP_ID=MMETSP1438-20131217/12193_1 /TAXON_ID=1461541 /ORGANISM="Pterosperma sp., Strain CCMP1384" /LENGTH=200 /DNA_ID=CAMNT_0043462161 /DNA_START=199 /DNA_END=801 /DNA_ORIENTATION=-
MTTTDNTDTSAASSAAAAPTAAATDNPIPPPTDVPIPSHLVEHMQDLSMQPMKVGPMGCAEDPEAAAAAEEAAGLLTSESGPMGEAAIRDRIAGKLQQGFSAIEQMGFNGDEEFMREWEEHTKRVMQFFRDHHPSEPGFQEARKALVNDFGNRAGLNPGAQAAVASDGLENKDSKDASEKEEEEEENDDDKDLQETPQES